MDNDKLAIKTLKHMLNLAENGEIYIRSIEEQGNFNDTCYVGERNSLMNWTTTLRWYSIPKKTYKSQQEIYQELYDKRYRAITENNYAGDDYTRAERRSNRYAVENTAKVWREQWD